MNPDPLLKNEEDTRADGMEEGNPPSPPPLKKMQSSRDHKPKGKFVAVTSHVHLEEEHFYKGDHTHELRAGFIRKVYGLLAFQLTITIGIILMCMYIDGIRDYFLDHYRGCLNGFMVAWIVSLVICLCSKDSYPANYFWFSIFTIFMAFFLGVTCAVYTTGLVVLQALVLTVGLFVGLTLFTCYSGIDFSGMGIYLFAGLWVMLLWGIMLTIFGFATYQLYLLFGLILFSCYVIFDTSQIMRKFGYDDYIIAAIELYLDFVNLLLIILSRRGR